MNEIKTIPGEKTPAGDLKETVLQGTQPGEQHANAAAQALTTDRSWLIGQYKKLLHERNIPRPITYLLTRELGKGRQGVVYMSMRHGARGCLTRHAIKIFDPSIYGSVAAYWTDMSRIATQTSRLQPIHTENLVSRDAYEECNGVGFVQMSAIDGIDLQYLLEGSHMAIARSQSTDKEWAHFMNVLFRIEDDRFRLQPGIAIYILRKILIGLTVMHKEGFLHGDVKPSNVMIDRSGSIKLVDFGRAATIGEPVNILLGSPLYMAPEIHRLEPGLVQSDLFSAGLVGLEMICGQLWEDSVNTNNLPAEKQKLHEQMEKKMPPYARENQMLIRILKRFTHIDPALRYASAIEAEDSEHGLRGVHRQLVQLEPGAEYGRELQRYVEKLCDPSTGYVNPRMNWT